MTALRHPLMNTVNDHLHVIHPYEIEVDEKAVGLSLADLLDHGVLLTAQHGELGGHQAAVRRWGKCTALTEITSR